MSDENTARHAECTVEFDGVDITSSIKPYLLSLTFTDNEEDASDDLQIKLQDREGVWMTDWLQKMLDGDVSAASSDGYKVGDVVQLLKLIFHRQDTQELLKKLLEREMPEPP